MGRCHGPNNVLRPLGRLQLRSPERGPPSGDGSYGKNRTEALSVAEISTGVQSSESEL